MKRPSKIAFVLPDGMALGGVTTWSLNMARRLSEEGLEVSILEHTGWHQPSELVPDGKVSIVKCPGKKPGQAGKKDIAKYKPSYRKVLPGTIIPNWSSGTYATCASLRPRHQHRMRVIGFAHTDQPHYYEILSRYEPLISAFVAVSNEVAERLGQCIPERLEDIHVKPYAVEMPAKLDREYSQPGKPIRLLYAGRLEEDQKRISDLPLLVEHLLETGVDFQLDIAGDGPQKKALKKQFARIGKAATKRVHMCGMIDHERMGEVWRSADICILVSGYEGTSIAMLEAMGQGCVPVVTRVSGTADVIDWGKNGYTAEIGDMADMSAIIAELTSNRSSLPSLGHQARAKIVEHYSYNQYIEWFRNLHEQVWRSEARIWPKDRPLFVSTPFLEFHFPNVMRRLRNMRDAVPGLSSGAAARETPEEDLVSVASGRTDRSHDEHI